MVYPGSWSLIWGAKEHGGLGGGFKRLQGCWVGAGSIAIERWVVDGSGEAGDKVQ